MKQNTHRWTIYLRSWTNEDMSYFIKKVVFNLHPSFGDRAKRSTSRVLCLCLHDDVAVEAAPFEIEDVGWGEFEVHIRVYFQDVTEKPLDLYVGVLEGAHRTLSTYVGTMACGSILRRDRHGSGLTH